MSIQFKLSQKIHVDFQVRYNSYSVRLTSYSASGKAVYIDLNGEETRILHKKLKKYADLKADSSKKDYAKIRELYEAIPSEIKIAWKKQLRND